MEMQEEKETDMTEKKEEDVTADILYTVNEIPPWHECLLLGFQVFILGTWIHYLSMFVASLAIPNVLGPGLCLGEDNVGKAEITGTLFFVSGIVTALQAIFGIRLPIVQGGTFALMSPTLSYLSLPSLQCPVIVSNLSQDISAMNGTAVYLGSDEHREVWMSRLRTIQGSMMVGSLLEILLGFSGLVGFMLRFIGPLAICPTISLLGLSLSTNAAEMGAKQWWICLSTIVLMVIFSQYLGRLNAPCFSYSRNGGCSNKPYPVFKMFPVVLGAGVMWLICYILTLTNVLPNSPDGWGYGARTDTRTDSLNRSPWVRLPYPGQWGMPNVDAALVLGLLAGFISSMVESVGDYAACARLSGATPPPKHAINRGIGIEGIGCLIAGAFGTGNGTTSTSINVGVIGLTKVGSTVIVLYTAVFMIALAIFNKFGALFVTIPDPIIGGTFFLLFGMIVAVGVSNLQYVDMNSSRNLFVFGFSFFLGVTLPQWIDKHPDTINTGVDILDNSFTLLLKTSMFVGGVTAFFLDNTIPGTRKERGMPELVDSIEGVIDDEETRLTYDIPFCSNWIRQKSISRYIPFLPGYGQKEPKKMEFDHGKSFIDTEAAKGKDNKEKVMQTISL